MEFINNKKLSDTLKLREKERNEMAVMTTRGSAFVLDPAKTEAFLSQKTSEKDKKIIKERAEALRKILKDETRK